MSDRQASDLSKKTSMISSKQGNLLIPNTRGRLVFLLLTLILLVTVILGIVCIAEGADQVSLKIAVFLQIIGLFLVIAVSTSAAVFRFSIVNCSALVLLSLIIMVMEIFIATGEPSKASLNLAHASNVLSIITLLLTSVFLLIPRKMILARKLQPFALNLKTRKSSLPKQKKMSKEVHSIFEDWPDPIPFPVIALYTFNPTSPSELPFKKSQPLIILDCRGNWWHAKDQETGQIGFIPSNFVQVLQKAKVVKQYLAKSDDEASILENQVVEVMEFHEFLSLVRTVEGKIGSVPTGCLELIPDTALEKLKL